MRIVTRQYVRDFGEQYPDAKPRLEAWLAVAKAATWKSPADVRRDNPRASIVAGNRVVFDIRGGSYRLIAEINYPTGTIYVRFIGTHAAYDRINAATVRER